MLGGLWNVNLGYSCEVVKNAITEQLSELPLFNVSRHHNDKAIELSEMLRDFFAPMAWYAPFYVRWVRQCRNRIATLARQYRKLRGESRVKY